MWDDVISLQKYQFVAEDLEDKGHLGEGAFGTVSKMVFNKTKTMMAVKVCVRIYGLVYLSHASTVLYLNMYVHICGPREKKQG